VRPDNWPGHVVTAGPGTSVLSAADARRVVVGASLGRSWPDSGAVLRSTGLLQLDPLTRVDKAHRLTCLARMSGDAPASSIDAPLWRPGQATAFETWVHAVCLVPVEDWPLLRIARDAIRDRGGGPRRILLDEVLQLVASYETGATISEIEQPGNRTAGWAWSQRKHAVEYLLRSGELVCTERRASKRVYDLPGRRIPQHYLADANRPVPELLATIASRAISAMGVATAGDVARYYGISASQAQLGLEKADLRQIEVAGWPEPAWPEPAWIEPAWIEPARASQPELAWPSEPEPAGPVLIGPFDNLIWDRKRTRRVFGFDYVFEAYKPAAKRVYGYYVLGLLDGDEFTGRVDLSREPGQLAVLATHREPATDPARFAAALEAALTRLARQLGLGNERLLAGQFDPDGGALIC
jgi:uncharacterized protein YcaQ